MKIESLRFAYFDPSQFEHLIPSGLLSISIMKMISNPLQDSEAKYQFGEFAYMPRLGVLLVAGPAPDRSD